jgi:hypothetical protein
MLVRLTRIIKSNNDFSLKEIFINPSEVSYLVEDEGMKRDLKEGIISFNFHQSTGFTRLHIKSSGSLEEFTVIGDPHLIEEKIRNSILQGRKQLLKG